jgi:Spy/CpxP family protein refolding chaperone
MKLFENNRILFWILVFLVLVNISILAGYFIIFRNTKNISAPEITAKSGWALKEKLSLTPDQTLKVQSINSTYRNAAKPLIQNIQNKKAGLLNELSKDNIDTNVVSEIANQISIDQKKLQTVNINQFLELKKVCTPAQTQKLSQIYYEMYRCSNPGNGRGNGDRNGMGRRYRLGQHWQIDSIQKRN